MDVPIGKEESITMTEYLHAQETIEKQAEMIAKKAGDAEGKCTYSDGYISQPLYVCKTCSSHSDKPAGFCLGCALSCHLDHAVEEIFEKRNFRCDCGNSKFKNKCELFSDKEPLNSDNRYDQNFKGLYCYCSQPYNEAEDTMIQCTICQDWFHDKCMSTLPPNDSGDFICRKCIAQVQFLKPYASIHTGEAHSIQTAESSDPNSISETNGPNSISKTNGSNSISETNGPVTSGPNSVARDGIKEIPVRPLDSIQCSRPTEYCSVNEDTHFPCGWRLKLCRCTACICLYQNHNILFLTHENNNDNCLLYNEIENTVDGEVNVDIPAMKLEQLCESAINKSAASDLVATSHYTVEMRAWIDKFKAKLSNLADSGCSEITEEMIRPLLEETSEHCINKRRKVGDYLG